MNTFKLVFLIVITLVFGFLTSCEVEEDDPSGTTNTTSSTLLSSLRINGTLVADFDENTFSYTYAVKPALGVPEVEYTLKSNASTAQQINAITIPGITQIIVSSADGEDESIYEIEFTEDDSPVIRDSTIIVRNFSDLSSSSFQYFTNVVCNCEFQNGDFTALNPFGGSPIRVSLSSTSIDFNDFDELWLDLEVTENLSDTKYVFVNRNFDENDPSTYISFTQSIKLNVLDEWSSVETVEVRVNETTFSTSQLYGVTLR